MTKICTTIEQSKKLIELGIDARTADMYYFLDPTPVGNIYHLRVQRVDIGIKNLPQYNEGDIPCWSLAALLSVIPNYKLSSEHNHHTCTAETSFGKETVAWFDNPVDACYDMILKLHELNLL